jgi:hypothetical protein
MIADSFVCFPLINLAQKDIVPILLYGCEVWGFSKNEIIERVHLRFCKLLLNFKTSTPSYMVYGELCRYPLDIDIKVRTISGESFTEESHVWRY